MTNASAYIAYIGTQVIYGLSIFFTTGLLLQVSMFDILAIRFLFSCVGCLFLRYSGISKVDLKGKPVGILVLASIFQPVLYFVFETTGLKHTSTLITGMMFALMPVLIIITERIILKEMNTRIQNILILTGMSGAVYVSVMSSTREGANTLYGILFISLAMLSGSFYIISIRKASRSFSSFEITYCTAIVGFIVFTVISLILHIINGNLSEYFRHILNPANIPGFIYLGIISSIGATFMGSYALSRVSGVSTITSIIASILIRGESFIFVQSGDYLYL